jgi:hypothetical protein
MFNDNIEKKKEKLKSVRLAILKDFPDVDGLENVLDSVSDLSYSEVFKELTKNMGEFERIFNEGNYAGWNVPDDIVVDFPQIKYVRKALLPSKIYFLIPQRFLGPISIIYYTHLIKVVSIILIYNGENVNYSRFYNLSHKIMILLDDFDRDIPFKVPDEEYFMKLRELKWNKDAKRLLDRIDKFFDDVGIFVGDMVFDEDPSAGYPIIMGLFSAATKGFVMFLSGCSAVNNNKNIMEYDDVISAFKTYFKVLNLKW